MEATRCGTPNLRGRPGDGTEEQDTTLLEDLHCYRGLKQGLDNRRRAGVGVESSPGLSGGGVVRLRVSCLLANMLEDENGQIIKLQFRTDHLVVVLRKPCVVWKKSTE
jgi:hypothetical protein